MTTGHFTSTDNTQHFYRAWNYKAHQKSILIMHRGHEHSARLEAFATDPLFAGYNVFSYDQRGLGLTETKVSPHFMDYVRDLDCFVSFLETQYSVANKDLFVVANSIAGVIVTGWLHDFARKIAGVALLAPAFGIKLYIPLAKQAVSLAASVCPNFEVPSYVKSKVLTHDIDQQKAYDSDPMITHAINGALLVEMLNHGKRIVNNAEAINTPTLLLSAQNDYVVKDALQKRFFVAIDTPHKEFKTIAGAYHGLLFETMKKDVYRLISDFMTKCFAMPIEPQNLDPDRFTLAEYNRMMFKMIPRCEKTNFAIQRFMLPKIGGLSKGMGVGLKYGFDSGISLDYVYQNKVQGTTPIGKMMDKGYLNAIGWRGIRERKQNLIKLIETQILKLEQAGQEIKILDIAGGTGNYLIDIKTKYPKAQIVINDFSQVNVDFGEKTIAEKGLTGIKFTKKDCFNNETYAQLNFTPNIAIVSGIFELFGDNDQVNVAVSGIASILSQNGVVIYTGQPWHPQLKMIAFVLNSHRGVDWVMRRRSQKELDKIFSINGFNKNDMLIDDFGIFTVSAARIIK